MLDPINEDIDLTP